MTSLIDSENGIEREALAAWHEDRRGWSVVRCHCGVDAVTRLVLIWDGRVEQARTVPYCKAHLNEALDRWNRICAASPEAVEGLSLNVGVAW